MRQRVAVLLGTTGLILASVVGLGPPGLAAVTRQQPAATGPLLGALAVRGTVMASGHPLARADVTLYAWPRNSSLSKLRRPGQVVPVRVVGTATTTASGQYAIAVSSPVALRSSAMPNGIVNLEVDALTRTAYASFSFSRRLVQTAYGTEIATASPDGVSRVAAPERADLQLIPLAHALPRVPTSCVWAYIKTFSPTATVIGATYDTTTATTQTFIYGRGQSSSLGVSTSNTGSYGTFTASGTASYDTSSTTQFPSSTGAVSTHYLTDFSHSEYGQLCQHINGYQHYQTRVTEWDGGATTGGTGAPTAHFCSYYLRGTVFTKTDSSAFVFSGGFTIPVIGVSLSAQTGYSVNATVVYNLGLSHYLCGTNDYVGGSPKRIVAGRV